VKKLREDEGREGGEAQARQTPLICSVAWRQWKAWNRIGKCKVHYRLQGWGERDSRVEKRGEPGFNNFQKVFIYINYIYTYTVSTVLVY
jgi:hypothetical protein